MKYRLKKDLPFAKAGTPLKYTQLVMGAPEMIIREREKVYVQGETFSNEKESILLGYAQDLLDKGWIEKVKPREWTLLKSHNGEIVNAREGHNSFEGERLMGISERINVTEVL